MLIAAIITGIIGLVCGIVWIVNFFKDGIYEGGIFWGIGFWVFGVIWFFTFLASLNMNFGTNNLTGYIYSSDTKFGYTTGHIRFSENAGMDEQPSFCVKSDSEAGRQIKELTGSGKKVSITEPPYFYFANNPFACGTTKMTIEVQ